MPGHTPGPWKLYRSCDRPLSLHVIDSIPDVDGKIIANCICYIAGTNEDQEANARIIIEVPEMFAILEELYGQLDPFEVGHEVVKRLTDVVDRVKAIAEAEGGGEGE
jgi:hypothetical protein